MLKINLACLDKLYSKYIIYDQQTNFTTNPSIQTVFHFQKADSPYYTVSLVTHLFHHL